MAKVTESPRLQEFMDPERYRRVMAKACGVVLATYFAKYAKKDMASKPWNTALSPAYRRWKTGGVRKRPRLGKRSFVKTMTGFRNYSGIADLFLTGKLRDEFLDAAPGRVRIRTSPPGASTYIDGTVVPYAAAHQYGSGNLPKRRFVRLEEHSADMVRELRRTLVRHHAQAGRA